MIYQKTEAGQAAFKSRSPLFSSGQRSTFILVDGKKSEVDLLAATSGLGVTQSDLDYLVKQGLLVLSESSDDVQALPDGYETAPLPIDAMVLASGLPVPQRNEQERYQLAKPIATQLTAGLGLRGFMLNLSVESASGYAELLALLPKIQAAVGVQASQELKRALKG